MTALIVDDERLARNELRRLLAAHSEIEIAGEARNVEEALQLAGEVKPDLLFLDIQMPGQNGFDLLERLERVPQVIFTTAYDEYALKAFEVNAIDYLLKPIAPERLAAALERLGSRRSAVMPGTQQIFVRDGERYWFVRVNEIALLESEGNYTRLYFGQNRPLLLKSLNYLEGRLDTAMFFRASRKHILNLTFIESISPGVGGGFLVKLKTGHEVEMSRRQSQRFRDVMSV